MIVKLETSQPFEHEQFGPVTLTHRVLSFSIGGGGRYAATVQSIMGFYLRDMFGPTLPDKFIECHETRDAVTFTQEQYDVLLASEEGNTPDGDVSITELAEASEPRLVQQWTERLEKLAYREQRKREEVPSYEVVTAEAQAVEIERQMNDA